MHAIELLKTHRVPEAVVCFINRKGQGFHGEPPTVVIRKLVEVRGKILTGICLSEGTRIDTRVWRSVSSHSVPAIPVSQHFKITATVFGSLIR